MLPALGAGLGLGFIVAMITLTEPRASHYSMNLSLTFFLGFESSLCATPQRDSISCSSPCCIQVFY